MTIISPSILPHNDIHFDATGNLVMAVDEVAIGQHVRQRLMFWKGEWFLDTEAGVDWRGEVFSLRGDQSGLADAVIKAAVAGTPGVEAIEEYSARYDRASRGIKADRIRIRVSTGKTVALNF
jgi:hypothetical protein